MIILTRIVPLNFNSKSNFNWIAFGCSNDLKIKDIGEEPESILIYINKFLSSLRENKNIV